MSQQLSLKSRPRRFSDLIGQEKVINNLRAYYQQHDDLPVALMFTGPTGTGKTSTARICSIALECTHSEEFGSPCVECYRAATNPYKYHSDEFALDHTEINCAAHSLDDLKKLLQGHVYAPANGARFRQYTLDELQSISSLKAQNFLLKILEDSPSTTKFYLATTDDSQILDTVIDRCIQYRFRQLKSAEIPQLVQKLLQRQKSDLDPMLLSEVLDERRVGSPRAIAQAVTKYLAGDSPEDAVKHAGGGDIDTGRVCRNVVKGEWDKLSEILRDVTPDQARLCRSRVTDYLKTIVLEDTSLTKRQHASKGIARLTQILSLGDDLITGAVVAGLHDVTTIYAGS